MLRNVEIPKNVKIQKWEPEFEEYYIWIYDQLMGETEHGDKMEPKILSRKHMQIRCGLLWGADGKLKGIVPEIFSTDRGNEYLCITTERIEKGYKDEDKSVPLSSEPISLDDATKRFLAGEDVWL